MPVRGAIASSKVLILIPQPVRGNRGAPLGSHDRLAGTEAGPSIGRGKPAYTPAQQEKVELSTIGQECPVSRIHRNFPVMESNPSRDGLTRLAGTIVFQRQAFSRISPYRRTRCLC
jgi:hypothetical protein